MLEMQAETKNRECGGSIRTNDIEQLNYSSMVEKLRDFKSLSASGKSTSNPKLTAAKDELAQVDAEIEKLVDSLSGANETLIRFANRKADELKTKRTELIKQIADLSSTEISVAGLTVISGYLMDWENASFDDKRQVVDSLISVIRATYDNIEIEWEF